MQLLLIMLIFENEQFFLSHFEEIKTLYIKQKIQNERLSEKKHNEYLPKE